MSEPTLAQGLTALLTPLATVGASAYTTQTKAQINSARIKAGKEPCTGQYGQPADCPAMFAPGAPAETPGTEQQGGGGNYPPQSSGISPMVIVILLAGAGLVVFLLMSSKKTPAASKRKKSRRK